MKLRSLESTPFDVIYDAFRRAFADYTVSIAVTRPQLEEIHRRRGVRLDLSVGAFDHDELVGFTFNALGTWDGRSSGYDSGTGVCPDARGRRLSTLMMERSLELLRTAGANRYVLEVIQSNTPAFRVYESIGFEITRSLFCWDLDRVAIPPRSGIDIEIFDSLDAIDKASMHDWSPSWQNSTGSIGRAREPRTILAAVDDDEIVGYAVLFDSGDLAQFAVTPSRRRQGIGTTLLCAARAQSSKPLRIINTDAGDAGTTCFLEALGGTPLVSQYEMVLDF